MNLKLISFEESHRSAVEELFKDSWRAYCSNHELVPAIAPYPSRRFTPTTVAVHESSIVGFSEVKGSLLSMLYVSPTVQKAGVGATLLQDAVKSGAKYLWVDEVNTPAKKLYAKHGWGWSGHKAHAGFFKNVAIMEYCYGEAA